MRSSPHFFENHAVGYDSTPVYKIVDTGDFDFLSTVIYSGTAELSYIAQDGQNLLLIALRSNRRDLRIVKLLLSQPEIDVNHANKTGCTPLLAAVETDDKELVAAFLEREDIDINKADNKGMTPLLL